MLRCAVPRWLPAETGDRPGLETSLPKEATEEMRKADKGQVVSMSDKPWWDWDEEKQVRWAGCWTRGCCCAGWEAAAGLGCSRRRWPRQLAPGCVPVCC